MRFAPLRRNLLAFGPLVLAASAGCNLVLGLGDFVDAPSGTGGAGGGGSCDDGLVNGSETGTDCGGACAPCATGEGCALGPDCASKVCVGGTCIAPTCGDQVTNGDETDVDCGAGCAKCGPDKGCASDTDCKSGTCAGGACLSTCTDGLKGASESDVDCGGGALSGCAPCAIGKVCSANADCDSGVCKASACVSYHVWSKVLGTGQVNAMSLATNGAGEAVWAAGAYGTFDFGDGPLEVVGKPDILLAKLDKDGGLLWNQKFGGANYELAGGVTLDSKGDVLLAGKAFGDVFFGGGVGSLPSPGHFTLKLNNAGNAVWGRAYGAFDIGAKATVAVGADGAVAAAGEFSGSITVAGKTLASLGSQDLFVTKLDAAGKPSWGKTYGVADGYLSLAKIVIDGAGNLLVAGGVTGAVDFGCGAAPGDDLYTDVFVTKLSPEGACLWSRRYGGAELQAAKGLAVDAQGNVVLTGLFAGTVDFGAGPITTQGAKDIFVAKLDPSGNPLWSKTAGDSFDQEASAVAVDPAGNVLAIGSFSGEIDFGGGPLVNAASSDVWVAKLAGDGSHLWSRRFGDVSSQYGVDIAAADAETMLITGTFNGKIDLGGGPLSGGDVFLAKLRAP